MPSGPLLNEQVEGQFMSLDINKIKEQIEHGNTPLGIELGSTRIKAVLIGEDHTPGPIPWRISGPASGTATAKWLRM